MSADDVDVDELRGHCIPREGLETIAWGRTDVKTDLNQSSTVLYGGYRKAIGIRARLGTNRFCRLLYCSLPIT